MIKAPDKKTNNNLLLQYAGFATQLLIALGIAVFAGVKIDHWLKFSTPVASWLLPLLVIAALIFKVVKDTSSAKKK